MPSTYAINVNGEGLRAFASSLRGKASELLASQQRVTSLIGGMGADFSGRLPGIILTNLRNMGGKYQAMNDNLMLYAGFLEETATTYEQVDAQTAQAITSTLGTAVAGLAAGAGVAVAAVTPVNQPAPAAIPARNMDSIYYRQSRESLLASNDYYDNGNMDCVYYARSRASEANERLGNPVTANNAVGHSEPRTNSIARFTYTSPSGGLRNHSVYVEEVTEPNGQTMVRFTESNWGNTGNGHEETLSQEGMMVRNYREDGVQWSVSSVEYFYY